MDTELKKYAASDPETLKLMGAPLPTVGSRVGPTRARQSDAYASASTLRTAGRVSAARSGGSHTITVRTDRQPVQRDELGKEPAT